MVARPYYCSTISPFVGIPTHLKLFGTPVGAVNGGGRSSGNGCPTRTPLGRHCLVVKEHGNFPRGVFMCWTINNDRVLSIPSTWCQETPRCVALGQQSLIPRRSTALRHGIAQGTVQQPKGRRAYVTDYRPLIVDMTEFSETSCYEVGFGVVVSRERGGDQKDIIMLTDDDAAVVVLNAQILL